MGDGLTVGGVLGRDDTIAAGGVTTRGVFVLAGVVVLDDLYAGGEIDKEGVTRAGGGVVV